ncbi:hypothetical protein D3C77_613480 [compost metagenome]
MNLVEVDFSQSGYNELEEQLALAVMMAIKKNETVISWAHSEGENSFCLVYNYDVMRLSMSRMDQEIQFKAIEIMEKSFGKPIKTFNKESSIDPGLNIFYMEWNSEVCQEIMKKLYDEVMSPTPAVLH